MQFKSFGWILAAALAAVFVAGGFQSGSSKVGVVDLARVFNDSDYAKDQEKVLRAYGDVRNNLMEFVDQYRIGTAAEIDQLKALSLKTGATDADKLALDKLKKDIQARDAAFRQLQTKPNPTPAEVTQLTEFNTRSQANYQTLQKWSREFEDDVRTLKEKMRADTMDRVNKAVKEVGAKQGFTIVFSQDASPYGANDLTNDALNAMKGMK